MAMHRIGHTTQLSRPSSPSSKLRLAGSKLRKRRRGRLTRRTRTLCCRSNSREIESGDVLLVTDRTLWRDVLDEMERRVGAGAIDMWLRDVALVDADREEVVLAVPTRFARQRIEGKLGEAVAAAFEALLGARPAIRVVVDSTLRE